jgi:hypothetical protein
MIIFIFSVVGLQGRKLKDLIFPTFLIGTITVNISSSSSSDEPGNTDCQLRKMFSSRSAVIIAADREQYFHRYVANSIARNRAPKG